MRITPAIVCAGLLVGCHGSPELPADASADSAASDADPDAMPPLPGTLAIEPPAITVPAGGNQIFVASSSTATWSVLEAAGGTIDAAGSYVAPDVPGTFHVVATDGSSTASATIRVDQMNLTVLTGGLGGFGNVDGIGDEARFNDPQDVAYDGAGTLYMADGNSSLIRAIDLASGSVTTLAGGGTGTEVDGIGTAARFHYPWSLALDRTTGTLYVSDAGATIRAIDLATRMVTTIAGQDFTGGFANGPGTDARFRSIRGLCLVGTTLYIADAASLTIRSLDTAVSTHDVHVIAGQNLARGFDDSVDPLTATFNGPMGLACTPSTVYVADYGNSAIRTIDLASGAVATLVGSPTAPYGDGDLATAGIGRPTFLAIDATNAMLYSNVSGYGVVRAIDLNARTITTVAGDPAVQGWRDGATGAQLRQPSGMATDGQTLWFGDRWNYEVRAVELGSGAVTTIAGAMWYATQGDADSSLGHATFTWPTSLATDPAGNIFVACNDAVRMISLAAGEVSLRAGKPGVAGLQDGGPGVARLRGTLGLHVDPTGKLWEVGYGDAVREVTSDGTVTTRFGSLGQRGAIDQVGTAAEFYAPAALVYVGGKLFVADGGNYTIRAIDLATGMVTTFAGSPGVPGHVDGVGGSARFNGPYAIATDGLGTVWVGDLESQGGGPTIRAIDVATATVTTIAGDPTISDNADGIGTSAHFTLPYALAYDGHGSLYVTDTGADKWGHGVALVRRIWIPSRAVSTYAGHPGKWGAHPGPLQTASLAYPEGLALTPSGDVLITGENAVFAIVRE